MKRFTLIFAILTLVFTSNSSGQALITKDDSLSINQDTIVKFIVPEYRGILQWQKSLDGENWIDLEGKNSDTLQIDSKDESLYRAQVIDGTCMPVYSDSAIILSTDTLSTNFMAPADSGLVLISDSVTLSEGIYKYFIDTTQFSGINVGTVIIDEKTGGSIRRVTNVVQSEDTVTVETNQANMEDLFFDTSFKLSTDMVKPSVDLKSATTEEIEEALTDEKGFIHPVEMVIHTKSGKKLKSALVPQNEGGGTFGDNLYVYENFTGRDLFYYSNGEDLSEKKYDNDGNINDNYTYEDTADIRLYIQEGHFEFNPVFKFEFDFEAPNFNWRNLNFNKGELKRFKFYSDESSVDFKCIVAVDACYEMTFKKFKKIKDDLIKVSFKFLVEGVPVWIDVNVDIFSRFNSELQAELYASAGFQSKHTITVGAGYESGGWYDIYEYTPENTIFPLQYKGHANLSQRFELYPRVDVKIYSFFGPNLEIIPFLEDGLNVTLAGNRNDWIDLGLDIRAGCEVGILGKTLYDYQSDNINLFRTNLYNAPDNLEIISGNNQTAPENSKLPNPIVLEVRDNLNFPLSLIPVYFETSQGTLDDNKIFSDGEGRVSVNWTLDNTSGSKQLVAYCRDGNDNVLKSSIITINAQATQTISTPTIVTNEATDITENSATLNGEVISDGGSIITERGFYWSETDQTPDTDDNKVFVNGTIGSYNMTISGLQSETKYYYRAFATNDHGTSVGTVKDFTTEQEAASGTFTDSRDGNTYKLVKIGEQVWMAENLAYLPEVNPPSVESNTEPYYYVYDYNGTNVTEAKATDNYNTYGVLYNWPAALEACPDGWHLPSDEEWEQLAQYVSDQKGPYVKDGGNWYEVAKHLKTTSGWNNDGNGTDDFGFSALPGGDYCAYTFSRLRDYGSWWIATEYLSWAAWYGCMAFDSNTFVRVYEKKESGYSVRCVKD